MKAPPSGMKCVSAIAACFLASYPLAQASEFTLKRDPRGIEMACIRAAEIEFPAYKIDTSSIRLSTEIIGPDLEERTLVSTEAFSDSGHMLGIQCQFTSASSPFQLGDLRCQDFACHVTNHRFGKVSAILAAEGYR